MAPSCSRLKRTLRLGAAVRWLPMPVLPACGDADREIALGRMLATWAKYPPGTGLHVWHGVGHSPNVEVPDRLAGLLRRFIEETIPSRRGAAIG
jgi:pimeloyl-ACP methyl ester carboxylesterase